PPASPEGRGSAWMVSVMRTAFRSGACGFADDSHGARDDSRRAPSFERGEGAGQGSHVRLVATVTGGLRCPPRPTWTVSATSYASGTSVQYTRTPLPAAAQERSNW